MSSSSSFESVPQTLPQRYRDAASSRLTSSTDGSADDDTAFRRLLSILDRPQFDFVRVAALRADLHGSQALRSQVYLDLYAFHTRSLSALSDDQRQSLVNLLSAYFRWDNDAVHAELHDAIRSS